MLSNEERKLLVDICRSHVAGCAPVMVTCSRFSTAIAMERARYAAERRASLLMLMPPSHGAGLKADEAGMLDHFSRVAEAAAIPIRREPRTDARLRARIARSRRQIPPIRARQHQRIGINPFSVALGFRQHEAIANKRFRVAVELTQGKRIAAARERLSIVRP